ncbi:MAG: SANT/Myb domain-containing protein [Holosporales bacterium]|jgi:hypothetical protein|nr:SANT/Myb domain-containing protein [Holosporales bacterium]
MTKYLGIIAIILAGSWEAIGQRCNSQRRGRITHLVLLDADGSGLRYKVLPGGELGREERIGRDRTLHLAIHIPRYRSPAVSWTESEVQALPEAVARHTRKNGEVCWQELAREFPGKLPLGCRNRWFRYLKHPLEGPTYPLEAWNWQETEDLEPSLPYDWLLGFGEQADTTFSVFFTEDLGQALFDFDLSIDQ